MALGPNKIGYTSFKAIVVPSETLFNLVTSGRQRFQVNGVKNELNISILSSRYSSGRVHGRRVQRRWIEDGQQSTKEAFGRAHCKQALLILLPGCKIGSLKLENWEGICSSNKLSGCHHRGARKGKLQSGRVK